MINFFQPEVTFVINYLIQCTVWKTGIVSKRLRNSRKTAFHCISIRVFNWNSEWLTATSWKSNNGWASCYWGRINFAIIWSWRKVNGSFYSPAARTTIMTKSDPTATWKTEIKDKKQSAREFLFRWKMYQNYIGTSEYQYPLPCTCYAKLLHKYIRCSLIVKNINRLPWDIFSLSRKHRNLSWTYLTCHSFSLLLKVCVKLFSPTVQSSVVL